MVIFKKITPKKVCSFSLLVRSIFKTGGDIEKLYMTKIVDKKISFTVRTLKMF